MLNSNSNEKTVYTLIYDKAKAKQLCEDCDKKFAEDFNEFLLETKADYKKHKIGLVVSLTICVISLVLAITHKINPCPLVISIAGAFFSFLASVIFGILIGGTPDVIESRSEDLTYNEREYAYPNLGKVYKAVGDGVILSVEIEGCVASRHYETCTINYKTEDNKPGRIYFFMDIEKSFDITEIEVDLVENVIRHPISVDEKNFKLFSESPTADNLMSKALNDLKKRV